MIDDAVAQVVAAYEALQFEDKIGTMLPCNVVVQELAGGSVEIAAIDIRPCKLSRIVRVLDSGKAISTLSFICIHFLVLSVLASSSPEIAFASETGEGSVQGRVVNIAPNDVLNIREHPSTTRTTIGTIIRSGSTTSYGKHLA